MYKSIIFVTFACLVALVAAGPNRENPEVQEGMKNAFSAGMERFGGAAKTEKTVPAPDFRQSKVFSLYSKGLTALGGGKPSVLDQYRQHHFVPLAPSVLPAEHKPVVGKMTAKDAAARYVPQSPLQFANERTHI